MAHIVFAYIFVYVPGGDEVAIDLNHQLCDFCIFLVEWHASAGIQVDELVGVRDS